MSKQNIISNYQKQKLKEIYEKHGLLGETLYVKNEDESIRNIIPFDPVIQLIMDSDPEDIRVAFNMVMKDSQNKEHVMLSLANIYYQVMELE